MGDVNDMIIERIRAGDRSALRELIEENRGLLVFVARRYAGYMEQRGDVDLDDLTQAGAIGIIMAAGKYDPQRGMKFSSFSVFYIKREMCRALGILIGKRDPANDALPLDTPLAEDEPDGATLIDLIAAEEEPDRLEEDDLRGAVRAAVGRIENDNHRRAIEEHYWNGKTMGQIASIEGVTHEAVSERIFRGYEALKRDKGLNRWAVDYNYADVYRHKGVRAFNTSFSSLVEDIVLRAETRAEERQEKQAALLDALGDLL